MKPNLYTFAWVIVILFSILWSIYIVNSNAVVETDNTDSVIQAIDLKPCDCPDGYTSIVEVNDPDASNYDLCSCTTVRGYNPTGSCKGEC